MAAVPLKGTADFSVAVRFADDAFAKFQDAVASLSDNRIKTVEARALNHTGDKAYTAVRKALIAQTSASRTLIDDALSKQKATTASLIYSIGASSRQIPLRNFQALQFKGGVRAKVWGKLQTYRSTFIVPAFQGGVFVRMGAGRGPIRTVYGPSIQVELIKDASLAAFKSVATELEARVFDEIKHMMAR